MSNSNMSSMFYKPSTSVLIMAIGGCGFQVARDFVMASNPFPCRIVYVDWEESVRHATLSRINQVSLGVRPRSGTSMLERRSSIRQRLVDRYCHKMMQHIEGAKSLIVTGGLGGNTGGEVGKFVLELAHIHGIPSSGVWITPFDCENRLILAKAHSDFVRLTSTTEISCCISNQRLLDSLTNRIGMSSEDVVSFALPFAVEAITRLAKTAACDARH